MQSDSIIHRLRATVPKSYFLNLFTTLQEYFCKDSINIILHAFLVFQFTVGLGYLYQQLFVVDPSPKILRLYIRYTFTVLQKITYQMIILHLQAYSIHLHRRIFALDHMFLMQMRRSNFLKGATFVLTNRNELRDQFQASKCKLLD